MEQTQCSGEWRVREGRLDSQTARQTARQARIHRGKRYASRNVYDTHNANWVLVATPLSNQRRSKISQVFSEQDAADITAQSGPMRGETAAEFQAQSACLLSERADPSQPV